MSPLIIRRVHTFYGAVIYFYGAKGSVEGNSMGREKVGKDLAMITKHEYSNFVSSKVSILKGGLSKNLILFYKAVFA